MPEGGEVLFDLAVVELARSHAPGAIETLAEIMSNQEAPPAAPPRARLDKLDALLAYTSTSAQDAALFAEMLSLPNDGRYPAVELTPQRRLRQERTFRNKLLIPGEVAHQNEMMSPVVTG